MIFRSLAYCFRNIPGSGPLAGCLALALAGCDLTPSVFDDDVAPVGFVPLDAGGTSAAAPARAPPEAAPPHASDAATSAPRADAGPDAALDAAPDTQLDAGAAWPDAQATVSGAGSAGDSAVVADAQAAADAASGALFPPFEADGEALSAPDRVWTYVEFPDSKCRDGSRAGISISLRAASRKLMIYLEGGVYCFDGTTCLLNPANVDDWLFNSVKSAPAEGIFDFAEPRNPVRDWNIVYVPNCTGDGHGGANPTPTDVPDGPRGQYFVGHLNLHKYLRRVARTFADATDVLLVGMSSGGFGTLQNLALVQRAFPKVKVRHVNDSGPPLGKSVIAECLQEKFQKLWRLDLGALGYCGSACPDPRNYLEDNALFLAKTFADRPAGFIQSIADEPMRMFYGMGRDSCTGSLLFDTMAEEPYRQGLLAYRKRLEPYANYGAFIAPGTQHTWLRLDNFYTQTSGGVLLVDWFTKIARGEAAGNVGP